MYGVAMHHTIKTLLEKGRSQRSIARDLGINRSVVRRVARELELGQPPGSYQRSPKLAGYEDQIRDWLGSDLSGVLIHQRLVNDHGLSVSYGTVRRKIHQLKGQEVYIPLHSEPGEEAQVDFGYLGRFEREGKQVKVWGFCMLLSHSRYGYYEAVTDQSIPTFLRCHQHGFEYFGGVPETVKLDNLKAGVLQADFYEPLIQTQYAAFLSHYGSAPITARVRRPEDKGKVESGIKYVKNNFVKGLKHRTWDHLVEELARWNKEVCNRRTHGTTRKVPAEVFAQEEQPALLSLPAQRFEIYRIEQRKVNRMGHISFHCNYYSVPHQHVGKTLTVKSNSRVLRIFDQHEEVALHTLAQGQGQYITHEAHKPPEKQLKERDHYQKKLQVIGPHALAFLDALYTHDRRHWKDKIRGIISLKRYYPLERIERACQRALEYEAYSYLTVKNICQHNLLEDLPGSALPQSNEGFHHELSFYDQLSYQTS